MDTAKIRRRFGGRLLNWYRSHRRELPWRGTGDPYRVMLSEFMLQQTQVHTVVPYYHQFLETFPDVQALARASQSEVLKVWEGLGYYSRARNLHRAAREIVLRFGGEIPGDSTIEGLPGFGPYTSAAVLSIAFGRDCAAVDGNVARVMARVFGIDEDVSRAGTKARIRSLAQSLLPKGRAADFNQAVMELGATVCRPRAPSCSSCPLQDACVARASGSQERLPKRAPRGTRPHFEEVVGIVVRKDRRWLIVRRPEEGLLGGLWKLPGGRRRDGESFRRCCMRGVKEEVGAHVRVLEPTQTVDHGYTHFTVTIHSFLCDYLSGRVRAVRCAETAWIWPADVREYAFCRAHRRLIGNPALSYEMGGHPN